MNETTAPMQEFALAVDNIFQQSPDSFYYDILDLRDGEYYLVHAERCLLPHYYSVCPPFELDDNSIGFPLVPVMQSTPDSEIVPVNFGIVVEILESTNHPNTYICRSVHRVFRPQLSPNIWNIDVLWDARRVEFMRDHVHRVTERILKAKNGICS